MQAEATCKQAEAPAKAACQQAEAAHVKAEMEAEIEILQMEKKKASAFARLNVLEQALGGAPDQDCLILAESEDPTECTCKYVLNQLQPTKLTTSKDNSCNPQYRSVSFTCHY